MDILLLVLQIVVALGIFNVWIIRASKATAWRGGSAKNMKEEFAVYGLPVWFTALVGAVKVSLAILLIVGIWIDGIALWAALALAVLMVGAVVMHIKVRDPLKKSLPAVAMFVMSALIVYLIG